MKNIFLIRFKFDDASLYFDKPFKRFVSALKTYNDLYDMPLYSKPHELQILRFSLPDCVDFLNDDDIRIAISKYYLSNDDYFVSHSKFVDGVINE